MKNVGLKSEKLYLVSSLYGVVHDLSLIQREYKSGRRIYILKLILTHYIDGVKHKKVFKHVYYNRTTALRSLKEFIYDITINNIESQLDLPF